MLTVVLLQEAIASGRETISMPELIGALALWQAEQKAALHAAAPPAEDGAACRLS